MGLPRINNYSLTTASQYVDMSGGGKVFLYVTGDDVRLGLDQYAVSNEPYFTILDGSTFILDEPLGIDAPVFLRADSGTATVRVLVTSDGAGY